MENLNEKLREAKNILIETQLSTIQLIDNKAAEVAAKAGLKSKSTKHAYICAVTAKQFNPEKHVEGGGPVTTKAVSVQAINEDLEKAQKEALDKAAYLLGL